MEKNGVIDGTLAKTISNTFDDANASIYTKIQQTYDNMEPLICENNSKFMNSDIYLVPTNSKGIPLLDTSKITNMTYFFKQCKNLVYVSKINMSNTSQALEMFEGCTSLVTIPELDTSNIAYMGAMFENCSNLVNVPVLNTSNVISIFDIFANCNKLSDDSLNNIMEMCINATRLTENKTLKYLGLSEEQANKCTTLSNYQTFTESGWTTGY